MHEYEQFEGLEVDFSFTEVGPCFGDLFTIVGYENPNFPPPGNFSFGQLASLDFIQVDDYFGIAGEAEHGDDVVVWLFPIVDGEVVDHHPGPFNGLRLSYDVLRNSSRNIELFGKCIDAFLESLPVTASFRGTELKSSTGATDAAREIVGFWEAQGITTGSAAALELDK